MIINRRFQRKNSIVKIGLISVVIAGASVYLSLTFFQQPLSQVNLKKAPTVEALVAEEEAYGLPVHLLIPKLNIDAPVDYMGLTPAGDMESPDNAQSVGWYKYGSRPGNAGSAVLAGHLGLGGQSVFMDLDKLQVGDELTVIDDQNQSVSFIVKQIRIYSKDDKPDEVFKSSGKSHLNLITCNGEWIESEKTYSERLIVFADKIH